MVFALHELFSSLEPKAPKELIEWNFICCQWFQTVVSLQPEGKSCLDHAFGGGRMTFQVNCNQVPYPCNHSSFLFFAHLCETHTYCRFLENLGWVQKWARIMAPFLLLQQSSQVPVCLLRKNVFHKQTPPFFIGSSWNLQVTRQS